MAAYVSDAAESPDSRSSELVLLVKVKSYWWLTGKIFSARNGSFFSMQAYKGKNKAVLTLPVISLVKLLVTMMTSSAMWAISLMHKYTRRRSVTWRKGRQVNAIEPDWMGQWIRTWEFMDSVTYISWLEEFGHGKECLSGLQCGNVLTLKPEIYHDIMQHFTMYITSANNYSKPGWSNTESWWGCGNIFVDWWGSHWRYEPGNRRATFDDSLRHERPNP